jgi:chromosome segregation ATPase
VQHTQALLGNEALRREVDGALSEDTGARVVGIGYGYGKAAAGVVVERVGREMLEIKEEVAVIRSEAGALRDTVRQMKEDIYERRGLLAKRGTKLAEAKRMMAEGEKDVRGLREQVEKVEEYGDSVHQKIGGDRRVLCREVCGLYGLQQKKRKRGASGRDVYLLGGVSVVDIRDINSKFLSQDLLP